MEPLSAATATTTLVKVVSEASLGLYNFINEVRNVDQNVKDLAAEVNALERTLLEVDLVLKGPDITSNKNRMFNNDKDQLSMTLYACLEECQETVVRLGSTLDGVRKKQSNWATQAFRQVKLNIRKDDINSLRSQIRTHHATLNTALQMVNIRAAYLAPGVIIDDLGTRISHLQRSLDLLTAPSSNANKGAAHVPGDSAQSDFSATKMLHSLGSHILAQATTVYASSVGDGSVHGKQARTEMFHSTIDWIPDPNTHESTLSTVSTNSSDRNQLGSVGSDIGLGTLSALTHTVPTGFDAVDSDSEAEFELELTNMLLKKGKQAFESRDYKGAVGFFKKAVATSNRLPHNIKSRQDVTEVPLMIATCKYHLGEIEEAKIGLATLMQRESVSDRDAIQKCQVCYLLSQICLITGDVEEAEDYCRKSLKGRRRILGRAHTDYFESLALLSEICLVRDKREEAAVYKDMIPPEIQESEETVQLRNLKQIRGYSQVQKVNARNVPSLSPAEPSRNLSSSSTTANSSEQVVFSPYGQPLGGHKNLVCGVAFSRDSTLLASASYDNTVRLWDARTGGEISRLEGHTNSVGSVAFLPSDTSLASVSRDKTIRIWDPRTGRTMQRLIVHVDGVGAVALSPGNSVAALASNDMTVHLWDLEAGREARPFVGHTAHVEAITFSSNALNLASSSYDTTVRLWDTKSGREISQLQDHNTNVHGMAFSPDDMFLASALRDGTVRVWDLRTNKTVRLLKGHIGIVNSVAFSPDGACLASMSADGTLRLWNLGTCEEMQRFDSGRTPGLAFSPDGSRLASVSNNNTLKLWRAAQDQNTIVSLYGQELCVPHKSRASHKVLRTALN